VTTEATYLHREERSGLDHHSSYDILRNQISIQASVLDGFGEMGGLDIFLAFQVGNGPGYL